MDRPDPVRGMAVHLFMDHVGVVRCASFLFERQTRKRVRRKPYVSTFTSMGVYTNTASRVFLPGRTSKNGSLHCPPEVGSVKKSTEVQSNRPLPTLLAAIAQNTGSSRVGSETADEGGCTGHASLVTAVGHVYHWSLPFHGTLWVTYVASLCKPSVGVLLVCFVERPEGRLHLFHTSFSRESLILLPAR